MSTAKNVLMLLLASAVCVCARPASDAGTWGARGEQRRGARLGERARFVKQEEVVTFARAGRVRVRAIEAPRALPRLEFVSERTGRRLLALPVGTSDARAYRVEPYETPMNPLVRFAVVSPAGLRELSGPLVVAVAVKPGGTDHGFETSVVGEAGGRLKVLTTTPLVNSIQGGVFVGDLGAGRGPGLAAWNFIWGDDEAHYAAHRYEVRLLAFDARRGAFRPGRTLRTKAKHASQSDALAELGLPRYANLLDELPSVAEYRRN